MRDRLSVFEHCKLDILLLRRGPGLLCGSRLRHRSLPLGLPSLLPRCQTLDTDDMYKYQTKIRQNRYIPIVNTSRFGTHIMHTKSESFGRIRQVGYIAENVNCEAAYNQ